MAGEIFPAIVDIQRNFRSDRRCIFTALAAAIRARRARDDAAASAMYPMRFEHVNCKASRDRGKINEPRVCLANPGTNSAAAPGRSRERQQQRGGAAYRLR